MRTEANLDQAIRFVHGATSGATRRLLHAVMGDRPVDLALVDGLPRAHPRGRADVLTLAGRLDVLWMVGARLSEQRVGALCKALARLQHANGRFEPAWASPGALPDECTATALGAYWLFIGWLDRERASRAGRWLESQLEPRGRLPAPVRSWWFAAGLWYALGERAVAGWVFDELNTRIPLLGPSELAGLIRTLCWADVDRDHRLLSAARHRLEGLQRADGSWPGGLIEPAANATAAAVHALRLLRGEPP